MQLLMPWISSFWNCKNSTLSLFIIIKNTEAILGEIFHFIWDSSLAKVVTRSRRTLNQNIFEKNIKTISYAENAIFITQENIIL